VRDSGGTREPIDAGGLITNVVWQDEAQAIDDGGRTAGRHGYPVTTSAVKAPAGVEIVSVQTAAE